MGLSSDAPKEPEIKLKMERPDFMAKGFDASKVSGILKPPMGPPKPEVKALTEKDAVDGRAAIKSFKEGKGSLEDALKGQKTIIAFGNQVLAKLADTPENKNERQLLTLGLAENAKGLAELEKIAQERKNPPKPVTEKEAQAGLDAITAFKQEKGSLEDAMKGQKVVQAFGNQELAKLADTEANKDARKKIVDGLAQNAKIAEELEIAAQQKRDGKKPDDKQMGVLEQLVAFVANLLGIDLGQLVDKQREAEKPQPDPNKPAVVSPERQKPVLKVFDENKNSEIDRDEAVKMLSSFDEDKSGKLSADELKKGAAKFGLEVKELGAMLKNAGIALVDNMDVPKPKASDPKEVLPPPRPAEGQNR